MLKRVYRREPAAASPRLELCLMDDLGSLLPATCAFKVLVSSYSLYSIETVLSASPPTKLPGLGHSKCHTGIFRVLPIQQSVSPNDALSANEPL